MTGDCYRFRFGRIQYFGLRNGCAMTNRHGRTGKKTNGHLEIPVLMLLVGISIPESTLAQDFSDARIATETAVSSPRKSRNFRFRQLRFSPDGRYILAQHSNGVALLTADPFHIVFQRSAENVSNAGFTPDSQQIWLVSAPSHVVTPEIAFAGSSHYVERWSIAGGARIEMKETRQRSCESSALSPDGHVLACVDTRGALR